jgi:hypothetical protein
MEKIHAALGSNDKQMLWVEGGGHVITEEPTRETVFQAAADFVKRLAQSQVRIVEPVEGQRVPQTS